ncbi:MAG TPA: bestrophin family ion channel [Pyrinomonadaceae bacterium]|jgi:putative membrane protein
MIEYDPHHWLQHLFDIKGSVVRQIMWRVLLVVAWSALIVSFHHFVRPVGVGTTMHTLIGVALGLLLVIRTNASYERFWEGRKLWGGIVNESRNLARSAAAYLHRQPALLRPVILWATAFPYAAMHALRGAAGLGPPATRLPAREVADAVTARHVPTAVALRISTLLAQARAAGHISDNELVAIDGNVKELLDYVGGCERITKTPLPFAYVVHLRRALIIYCITLPFALADVRGWAAILDTLLIAYILFGIDEIGVEIENPFGTDDNDLPLEQICATIESNLLGLVADEPAAFAKSSGA